MDRRELRRRLGLVAGSAELVSIRIASYIPINAVRIGMLRLWGARIGRGCVVYNGIQVRVARRLVIGEDCLIADRVILDASGGLRIGAHVSVNSDVHIWTSQHDWRSPDFARTEAAVTIGTRCWVSDRATVLPGATIGEGTVVAAGAVVTGPIPEWKLAAGNPAKVIADRPRVDRYRLNARANKIWWF